MADIMRNEYKEELVLHKYQPDYVKDSSNDFVLVSRTYVKDSKGNTIGGVAQVHFREQSVNTARRMIKEYNELEFLREQYQIFNESQLGVKDINRFNSVRKAAVYLGMSVPTFVRKWQMYRD